MRLPRSVLPTALVGVAALLLGLLALVLPGRASAAGALISQGKPTAASSVENGSFVAANAVDGNTGTRWSSGFSDPQWLRVDLGATATIDQVRLNWEAAYGRAFQIQVSGSADGPWTTIYSTTTGTGGVQTLSVSGTGRYVRMYGTQRATQYGYSLFEFQVFGITTGTSPTTTPPPSDSFWGDTSSIPAATQVLTVKILNRTNGRYPDSQVYWSFNGTVRSIAQQQYLDMPANSAGRMYFYLGSPTSAYYDFIEFTVGSNVFNGNTTRVDAFGLKLAMRLHARDGYDVQVGENQATFAEDRATTFQRFRDAVPSEFDVLTKGDTRIISPGSDPTFQPGGVNQNYFSAYSGGLQTSNVFGCAGPLAGDPTKCAALNRHTYNLPQSQWETAPYYTASPANWYAKFWHDRAINGLAYGFPYDDVAGKSSFISHGSPQYLLVAVGW
jgi:hypothetical protein